MDDGSQDPNVPQVRPLLRPFSGQRQGEQGPLKLGGRRLARSPHLPSVTRAHPAPALDAAVLPGGDTAVASTPPATSPAATLSRTEVDSHIDEHDVALGVDEEASVSDGPVAETQLALHEDLVADSYEIAQRSPQYDDESADSDAESVEGSHVDSDDVSLELQLSDAPARSDVVEAGVDASVETNVEANVESEFEQGDAADNEIDYGDAAPAPVASALDVSTLTRDARSYDSNAFSYDFDDSLTYGAQRVEEDTLDIDEGSGETFASIEPSSELSIEDSIQGSIEDSIEDSIAVIDAHVDEERVSRVDPSVESQLDTPFEQEIEPVIEASCDAPVEASVDASFGAAVDAPVGLEARFPVDAVLPAPAAALGDVADTFAAGEESDATADLANAELLDSDRDVQLHTLADDVTAEWEIPAPFASSFLDDDVAPATDVVVECTTPTVEIEATSAEQRAVTSEDTSERSREVTNELSVDASSEPFVIDDSAYAVDDEGDLASGAYAATTVDASDSAPSPSVAIEATPEAALLAHDDTVDEVDTPSLESVDFVQTSARYEAPALLDAELAGFSLRPGEAVADPTPIPGMDQMLAIAGVESDTDADDVSAAVEDAANVSLSSRADDAAADLVVAERATALPAGDAGASANGEAATVEATDAGEEAPRGAMSSASMASLLAPGERELRDFVEQSESEAHVLATLEMVARRVRGGEIVPSIDAGATPEAVLASVLAAILSSRT